MEESLQAYPKHILISIGTNGFTKEVANRDVFMSKRRGDFTRYASKRKDIDPNGWYDVIAHGSPNAIEANSLHGEKLISARQEVALIQKQPGFKKSKAVRLLSCSTSAYPEGFAQHLANALGKPVYVPTKTIWADHMWISSDRSNVGKGQFVKYTPGGIKHGKK